MQVASSTAREVVRESTNELIKEYLASNRQQPPRHGGGSGGRAGGAGPQDPLQIFVQEEVVDIVVEEVAHLKSQKCRVCVGGGGRWICMCQCVYVGVCVSV